jgi:hypothetical protein
MHYGKSVHETDIAILDRLAEIREQHKRPWDVQCVLTKMDEHMSEETEAEMERIREVLSTKTISLPPIFVRSSMRPPYGPENLRASIMEACGLLERVQEKPKFSKTQLRSSTSTTETDESSLGPSPLTSSLQSSPASLT